MDYFKLSRCVTDTRRRSMIFAKRSWSNVIGVSYTSSFMYLHRKSKDLLLGYCGGYVIDPCLQRGRIERGPHYVAEMCRYPITRCFGVDAPFAECLRMYHRDNRNQIINNARPYVDGGAQFACKGTLYKK
ncbi:hypothetical protein CDAR_442581 [Caerostris darwini]|uniref:Uncharacterized protein n=1 Tax=Caerostris darwini TaxID=1538125 RepID=A0AAV4V0S9_9ARAC|nr:hypothetical protein CDAR_442581 [Caerostris darwini]